MVGILAAVTVPRLPYEAIIRKQCEAAAVEVAAHLRLTRQLAISNAATNRKGFRFEMIGSEPYERYRIVNVDTSEIVVSDELDEEVLCTGADTITFNPLGALTESKAELMFSANGKTTTLSVVPATGTVTWKQGGSTERARTPY